MSDLKCSESSGVQVHRENGFFGFLVFGCVGLGFVSRKMTLFGVKYYYVLSD